MGVRTIIAIRESPSVDKLFYYDGESPVILGPILVKALKRAMEFKIPAGYPHVDKFVKFINEVAPGLQLEDMQKICHPNNVRFIFPTVQADLEYVFEVDYASAASSIALYKACNVDPGQRVAYQLLDTYAYIFSDDDDANERIFDDILTLAGMLESLYKATLDAGTGVKTMFTDASELTDLTRKLIKMGLEK